MLRIYGYPKYLGVPPEAVSGWEPLTRECESWIDLFDAWMWRMARTDIRLFHTAIFVCDDDVWEKITDLNGVGTMPITNKKSSALKSKEEIEHQVLLNLTELCIYLDRSPKTVKELIRNDPAFPCKATRKSWTLRSIWEWEKKLDRVEWWEDEDDDYDCETVDRFDRALGC